MDLLIFLGILLMTSVSALSQSLFSIKGEGKKNLLAFLLILLGLPLLWSVPFIAEAWVLLAGPIILLFLNPSIFLLAKVVLWLIAAAQLTFCSLTGFCLMWVLIFSGVLQGIPDRLLLEVGILLFSILVYPLEKRLCRKVLEALEDNNSSWLSFLFLVTALSAWFLMTDSGTGGFIFMFLFSAEVLFWICLLLHSAKSHKEKEQLKEQLIKEKMDRMSACYDLECKYLHEQLHLQSRLYTLAKDENCKAILDELEKTTKERQKLFDLLACRSRILGTVLSAYHQKIIDKGLSISFCLIDLAESGSFAISESALEQIYEMIIQSLLASEASAAAFRQIQRNAGIQIIVKCDGYCQWQIQELEPFRSSSTSNQTGSRLMVHIPKKTLSKAELPPGYLVRGFPIGSLSKDSSTDISETTKSL